MSAHRADDQIRPETRVAIVPVIAVLFAAFVTLYGWPDQTQQLFAWTIRPSITPLVMGSGYLAGGYALAHLYTRAKWHEVAFAFPAIEAFTLAMAGATVLHWDRFNHAHPWFWVWVVVYAVSPVLVLAVWLRNRAADSRLPDPSEADLPPAVRSTFLVAGIVEAGVTALLYLAPGVAAQVWPWALTPLTSRVLGGWFLLSAVTLIVLSRERRWSGARIAVRASVLFAGLQLIGIVRAWNDFDAANPLTWAYVALVVVSIGGMGTLYWALEHGPLRRHA